MPDRTSSSRIDDGVITASDARELVAALCARYGFRLSPLWKARLGKNPPQSVKSFTDTVFRAEGLDPAAVEMERYRAVEGEVERAFERSAENQMTR